jgi:hypothetical protein
MEIAEADWKRLRALKEVALERLCSAILRECQDVIEAAEVPSQDRYGALYRHLHKRDKDIAHAFDGLSRSTALLRLASMCALDLVTEAEFAQFSADTQRNVRMILGTVQ